MPRCWRSCRTSWRLASSLSLLPLLLLIKWRSWAINDRYFGGAIIDMNAPQLAMMPNSREFRAMSSPDAVTNSRMLCPVCSVGEERVGLGGWRPASALGARSLIILTSTLAGCSTCFTSEDGGAARVPFVTASHRTRALGSMSVWVMYPCMRSILKTSSLLVRRGQPAAARRASQGVGASSTLPRVPCSCAVSAQTRNWPFFSRLCITI
mmetsp:Transcript_44585/g.113942  ORF Transcript_44585/g.113942 Transcript_44585/m.113942 type:complete len:209 (-) Transcript_44585:1176-1802(-)